MFYAGATNTATSIADEESYKGVTQLPINIAVRQIGARLKSLGGHRLTIEEQFELIFPGSSVGIDNFKRLKIIAEAAYEGDSYAQGQFTMEVMLLLAEGATFAKALSSASALRKLNVIDDVSVDISKKKPYSTSRPPYAKGQVDDVWESARQSDGNVYDPNTGQLLEWDKTKSRNGQWDMGHKPGLEYKKYKNDYLDGKITKKEFLDKHRNPAHYQPEAPGPNRSHKYEQGD